jgi:hypothetical protein
MIFQIEDMEESSTEAKSNKFIRIHETPRFSSYPSPSLKHILFPCVLPHRKWSAEENERFKKAIFLFRESNWKVCSEYVQIRSSKQCKCYWFATLNPSIKKDCFEPCKDELIVSKHEILGNRWTIIARFLPGRSPDSIKNRWISKLCNENEN